jgi:aconitate hydratase
VKAGDLSLAPSQSRVTIAAACHRELARNSRMNLPPTLQDFAISAGSTGRMHALATLETAGLGQVSRLPVCLRMILESVVRNCDGLKVTEEHVGLLAGWQANAPRISEIPLVVARILLQDFTGVPLICDLAAMRSAAQRLGHDAGKIEPRVPMDLVIDHSVQIDHYNAADALDENMRMEFQRNAERYLFIKWGMQAFSALKVVPPGIGIVHQVNLEHLAHPIWQREGVYFPDSVVGTDSHTTMINGLGVVGWGVGGIEAEAAMLGQPITILMPDVIGVQLHGALPTGATATDLVLRITEILRQAKVVGKFVEFFGDGAAALTVPDRATVGNMAPEYGATMGYFPIDDETLSYLAATGRDADEIRIMRAYLTAQGMFGMPMPGAIDYTAIIDVDLTSIDPCVAGPRRPQDRVRLQALKQRFSELFVAPVRADGYGKVADDFTKRYRAAASAPRVPATDIRSVARQEAATGVASTGSVPEPRGVVEMVEMSQPTTPTVRSDAAHPVPASGLELGHGDVLIAAITSCTNTSNPSVMIAAGLLAKKAVERGLRVSPHIKTSLAPGSRVVATYLGRAGLLTYLEQLGFWITAYGCTTCIGNSGPLAPSIDASIADHDLICAAVLSGNRNFEARIHPSIRANFLMSPPLVVAFAIAGRIGIDLEAEPIGLGNDGRAVFLRDLWPTAEEIAALMPYARDPAVYRERYGDLAQGNPLWNGITAPHGAIYAWPSSTYIAEPPFFQDFSMELPEMPVIRAARALAIFGNSLTTDHISPAGAISADSPAGRYLQGLGVLPADFNSYGARRGHHEVMMRGTFANVRIRNRMLPPRPDGTQASGGFTVFQPSGELLPIYDAAMRYIAQGTPTLVVAGEEYGTGSSRDWAAKGTRLLGVKAVVALSFERIHRSNLVGMGVLPLQFQDQDTDLPAAIRGDETFDIVMPTGGLSPRQTIDLIIHGADGATRRVTVRSRIDTPVEIEYYRHGGILPYAVRELLGR